jgi:hypothetical protein
VLGLVLASAPVARSWSTEGHMLTCQIAQVREICSLYRKMLANALPISGN